MTIEQAANELWKALERSKSPAEDLGAIIRFAHGQRAEEMRHAESYASAHRDQDPLWLARQFGLRAEEHRRLSTPPATREGE